MKIPFQIIQAFDDPLQNMKGNIAAVLELPETLTTEQMQGIASDINQPATTFLWKDQNPEVWNVRWFAPDKEIDLCGHGSLAAIAWVSQQSDRENFMLRYPSGTITGSGKGDRCRIELEAIPVIRPLEATDILTEGLGVPVKRYFQTNNKNIVVLESEDMIRDLKPDFAVLRRSDVFGYAVTARGKGQSDFVSRTLVPHVKQLEDPATGSSHAALVPFWARELGKNKLSALQLSPRGGKFNCELKGNTVILTGHCTILGNGFWNLH